MTGWAARLGERTFAFFSEIGYHFTLAAEAFWWTAVGGFVKQPVRLSLIIAETMRVGVLAIPIAAVLCLAVGVMLAIQGIENLRPYGAEDQVVTGIALAITREFSPLIVSILVAGRSASAMTARIGTMMESQEIDAMRVIGVNPVRYLAAPMILGTLLAVPALTVLGDVAGVLGGGLYASVELHISLGAWIDESLRVLVVDDIRQGLIKSFVFALIIALVGVGNGFQVSGGAEGVGRSTTRSVVISISLIVLADMAFTWFLNR
ncbi:MAG: ABC transporter permease [Pseudomonadota bacterium]|nr:ABC transporter permease [Pseudomonadota bacterium]